MVLAALPAVAAALSLILQVRRDSTQEARQRTLSVAQTFADTPGTAAAHRRGCRSGDRPEYRLRGATR
nr:hypothetical protein StreXyl84_02230 [Streptomyces sp. Xyl84]